MIVLALAVAIAYLAGSTPTAWLVGRASGVDLGSVGSGNYGATNVFRILGKGAGITVLVIDALKGFVPAKFLLFGVAPGTEEYHAMLAGLCAILGHNYTCWLGFKGGKGIATTAGVYLALAPVSLGIALVQAGRTRRTASWRTTATTPRRAVSRLAGRRRHRGARAAARARWPA